MQIKCLIFGEYLPFALIFLCKVFETIEFEKIELFPEGNTLDSYKNLVIL